MVSVKILRCFIINIIIYYIYDTVFHRIFLYLGYLRLSPFPKLKNKWGIVYIYCFFVNIIKKYYFLFYFYVPSGVPYEYTSIHFFNSLYPFGVWGLPESNLATEHRLGTIQTSRQSVTGSHNHTHIHTHSYSLGQFPREIN